MADTLQTQALITIAQNYAGDVVRQINRSAVFLKLLGPTFRPFEGGGPAWVAEADGAVAESFTEGAEAANFGSDAQAPATLACGNYWAPWHSSGNAMMAAASSRTPRGNIELWARNMVNSAEKLAKKINGDMYTATGASRTIFGLDVAIGDDANVYAGIDRSTAAYWRPKVVDPGVPTSITFKDVRDDMAAIKIACGYKPDIAMVSGLTLNKMATLFDPQKLYAYKTDVTEVMSAGQPITLEGGVGAIKFDGCYFVEDVFCPDNAIYYLNSRYIHLEYGDASASVPVLGSASDESIMLGGLSDGFDTIPMNIMLELLAKTGDSQKAFIKCYPQLVVERPNAFGVRLNVA